MFDSTSVILHLARGIGAILLIVILFFIQPHPVIGIILLIGAMLLLRGCPVCWFVSLTDKLTYKYSKKP